ncbi:putative metalloprotease CJM1_0395 family protein [Marinobacter fuscus]|uniref:putative metalloprotease CJM1_0395 family protein n=1 Tax=Marinobacter fuscus TaxID=2109942 RepID=UPI001F0C8989|nr:putative metalloprotease CJM1_0395 family protein [Marinobacter fuscus]
MNALSSLSPVFPGYSSGTLGSAVPGTESGARRADAASGFTSGAGSADAPPSSTQSRDAESRDTEGAGKASRPEADNPQALSEAELKQLADLKARDREVRTHEAAHQAVGGQYSGAISYTYQRGPDGAQYAVGGEVPIDVAPVAGDPQATIEKMRIVRAAAMAPAQPSAQDRAVAAQAMQTMLQAQAELAGNNGARAATPSETEDPSKTTTSASESRDSRASDAAERYRSVYAIGTDRRESGSLTSVFA